MKQEITSFTTENHTIGPAHRCYLIAEIGTSHAGDPVKAKELIAAAAESGADCAKFQVVFADEILHPLTGELDLPGGRVSLYSRFQDLEQDADFYAQLRLECQRRKIDFLASPFGIRSARLLRDLGSQVYKVASPELNHHPLLKELASYRQPLILSSGVSTLGDIEEALEVLGPGPRALLHCITAYPAPEDQYNLRLLPLLSEIFGLPTGTSDHSLDPLAVPLATALIGGSLVEKHFCLSRQDPGLDDPIALDPRDFGWMVREIRNLESLEPSQKHASVRDTLGAPRLEAILGTGKKTLAPAEKANYLRTNRSIHALKDLAAGEELTEENCGILRTEKILRPGLHPRYWPDLLGKHLTQAVEAGQGIRWSDVLTGPRP